MKNNTNKGSKEGFTPPEVTSSNEKETKNPNDIVRKGANEQKYSDKDSDAKFNVPERPKRKAEEIEREYNNFSKKILGATYFEKRHRVFKEADNTEKRMDDNIDKISARRMEIREKMLGKLKKLEGRSDDAKDMKLQLQERLQQQIQQEATKAPGHSEELNKGPKKEEEG